MSNHSTRLALTIVMLGVAVVAACSKRKTEAVQRQEVLECSRVNSQAELIALCLTSDHKWEDSAADRAGRGRAHELDSLRAWQEDSAFNVDLVQHKKDIRECSTGDVMHECLL